MSRVAEGGREGAEPARKAVGQEGASRGKRTPQAGQGDGAAVPTLPAPPHSAAPGRNGAERAIRTHLLAGLTLVVLLAGGVGGFAATTSIAGAVIAPGRFVVDSNVKKVQHPTGGIVGELKVRDGDHVEAGDLLARLDDTQTRANLAIVSHRLDELAARRARLEAERDGRASITFPAALLRQGRDDATVAELIASETRLFELRASARAGEKTQLLSRIDQLGEEVRGLTQQERAKSREIELINRGLGGLRDLWSKNLISLQRITAEERDAARLGGESGQLLAARAQAEGKISETRLQILQIDQDLRSDVAKELREVEAQMSEFAERKISAEDQLRRIDIRAPYRGVVHQLAVHTIGGVISPGEPIMLIVPVSDALRVEVRIAPEDIDQVHGSQRTVLRLSAFNQHTTPELNGAIEEVSPDLSHDEKTGVSFYTARVAIPDAEWARLGDLKVVPGMPAEAFIQTSSRTMLSYLVKPLADQIERAFREE